VGHHMTTARAVTLCVASLFIGFLLGYQVWSQQSADLKRELAQVRTWLTAEIQLSEARAEEIREASARHERADFQLKQAEAALLSTGAMLGRIEGDWKSERQRRRDLEKQIAATYHEPAVR
jgi:septal ring factor EnvC (AmiA/AmiB activator)